jgi:hypothetical protein
VRNVECILRKAIGNKWTQPKREVVWVANDKVIKKGILETFGAHMRT